LWCNAKHKPVHGLDAAVAAEAGALFATANLPAEVNASNAAAQRSFVCSVALKALFLAVCICVAGAFG
jgi:hypothetical protein